LYIEDFLLVVIDRREILEDASVDDGSSNGKDFGLFIGVVFEMIGLKEGEILGG